MIKKSLLSAAMIVSLSLFAQTSFAEDQCKEDKDCKNGEVCILALTPPVCKAPQAAGAACKRDVVCASKKCEIPAGKDAGVCK
jgi:Dickkopf N-terminal cysteine-rich region